MRNAARRRLLGAICLLGLWVQTAYAQDTVIAGVVRDATGAVLPGVTVEASSPSLIEKSRTATTDAQGQYKIVRLVAGTYTVTFSLTGFSTVQREGIVLQTDVTTPVNAELRVGAVEETITVSGSSPVVDTQSVASRTVMTRDVMDAIPTGRNIQAVGILIPGTGLQGGGGGAIARDVGGSGGLQQSPLSFRGATATIAALEGMPMSELSGVGQYTGYWNDGSFEEISYSTGADSAEIGQNGLRINMIPRDGGNSFRGKVFANWTGEDAWNGNNLDDRLRALGTTNVAQVQKIYDFNPSYGGPLVRDRLWFQGTVRYQGVYTTVVDSYFDKNPDPVKYEPDLARPGIDDGTIGSEALRLTWQATSKNKITGYVDRQTKTRGHWGLSATNPPEATAIEPLIGLAANVKWTATLTNRLLFDAGYGLYLQDWPLQYQSSVTPTTYRIVDQLSGKACCAYTVDQINEDKYASYSAKLSWVTGSHNFAGGFQLNTGSVHRVDHRTGNLAMRFGTTTVNADATGFGPNQVTLILPTESRTGVKADTGLWVTDKYTMKRATITAGLRFDWFIGKVGESSILTSAWSAARTFPGFSGKPNWKDLSPRLGFAYDLFGNAKTAVKFSASRYVDAQAVSFANGLNPINRLSNNISLTWTDNSRDFTIFNPDGSVQDVDFNPNAPIDPATGQRQNELAPVSGNSTFGQLVSTTRIDPEVQEGFGVRGYSWELAGGIQHELMPGVSVGLQYYRRYTNRNLLVTDDVNTGPGNFAGPYCVTTPSDLRLPDGGGQRLCGIYQPTQASLEIAPDNLQTFASTLLEGTGAAPIRYNHGIAFSSSARLRTGTVVQGGVSADKSINDSCYLGKLGSPQGGELRNPVTGDLYCHAVSPFLPDVKFLIAQNLPWDIQVSGTIQHTPGPAIQAAWTITQSVANASGWAITTAAGSTPAQIAAATTSVNLFQTGQEYADSLNQLDLRAAKRFSVGRSRIQLMLDLYNVLNSNWVYGVNTTLGNGYTISPTWLRPTNILTARMLKIGTQIDF